MKVFFLISFLLSFPLFAKDVSLDHFLNKHWPLNKTQKKYLIQSKVLTDAEVKTSGTKQSFSLKALAYHPKRCRNVLRKLSMLNKYKDWIDFIKYSHYKEKSKLFTLTADHPLLPYPMNIYILVERPTKTGIYPFTFPVGIFRGLKGQFHILEIDKRCFLFAQSNWVGPQTKIPNFVIEIFSETLSKLGGEILIRKTK